VGARQVSLNTQWTEHVAMSRPIDKGLSGFHANDRGWQVGLSQRQPGMPVCQDRLLDGRSLCHQVLTETSRGTGPCEPSTPCTVSAGAPAALHFRIALGWGGRGHDQFSRRARSTACDGLREPSHPQSSVLPSCRRSDVAGSNAVDTDRELCGALAPRKTSRDSLWRRPPTQQPR
jgi:hypothetical protein